MKPGTAVIFTISAIIVLGTTGCHRHADPAANLPGASSSDSENYLTKTEEQAQATADEIKDKTDKDAAEAQAVLRSQKERSENVQPINVSPAQANQAQAIIDNAKYLFAVKKYDEALRTLNGVSQTAMTPDQQNAVAILRAEIQRAMTTESSSAGNVNQEPAPNQPR